MKKIFYTLAALLVAKLIAAQSCPPATAYEFLDINNVKARINNGGDMWWDLNNNAQYVVPQSGNVSSLFAGAIWIGGIDEQGQLRMAAQTYRQTGNDFFPGPLDQDGNVSFGTCQDFDHIWKVNKSTIDSFVAGLFSAIPSSILQWPGKGNPNLPSLPLQNLAPFTDVNNDDAYDPSLGDYPDIPGDQALWFVFNDKGNSHTETGALPMGIEVQCTAYAFDGPGDCLSNATFYHYEIINKGSLIIDSTFVGLWTDPDLGCYLDDYMGCDSADNLGIVYNSTAVDGGSGCTEDYGNMPPVLAIDFLKGPEDENGITHYMDHFMYYNNDFSVLGNPEQGIHYYNYLQSIFKDGEHLSYGGNGYNGTVLTNYAFSGDPSVPTSWTQCTSSAGPSDLRMILSSGPFYFGLGETKTLDFAVVWDNTSVYPCPSFSTIEGIASCAKDYFNTSVQFTTVPTIPGNSHFADVFPNPVEQNGTLTFNIKNAERIRIFDIAGGMITNLPVKNQYSFQLKNNFTSGIYFYQVIFNDQSMKAGKLIVQ